MPHTPPVTSLLSLFCSTPSWQPDGPGTRIGVLQETVGSGRWVGAHGPGLAVAAAQVPPRQGLCLLLPVSENTRASFAGWLGVKTEAESPFLHSQVRACLEHKSIVGGQTNVCTCP